MYQRRLDHGGRRATYKRPTSKLDSTCLVRAMPHKSPRKRACAAPLYALSRRVLHHLAARRRLEDVVAHQCALWPLARLADCTPRLPAVADEPGLASALQTAENAVLTLAQRRLARLVGRVVDHGRFAVVLEKAARVLDALCVRAAGCSASTATPAVARSRRTATVGPDRVAGGARPAVPLESCIASVLSPPRKSRLRSSRRGRSRHPLALAAAAGASCCASRAQM